MRREYHNGTQWCFWRWKDIDGGYLVRLHLIQTPWFSICLHWINRPDQEPYYHDHPVSFLSLFIRGHYAEMRPAGVHYRRWFNLVRARDRHSIIGVAYGGALTLCFMGPREQEWGFFTPEGKLPWREYYEWRYP